jgi:hypothetical protein
LVRVLGGGNPQRGSLAEQTSPGHVPKVHVPLPSLAPSNRSQHPLPWERVARMRRERGKSRCWQVIARTSPSPSSAASRHLLPGERDKGWGACGVSRTRKKVLIGASRCPSSGACAPPSPRWGRRDPRFVRQKKGTHTICAATPQGRSQGFGLVQANVNFGLPQGCAPVFSQLNNRRFCMHPTVRILRLNE